MKYQKFPFFVLLATSAVSSFAQNPTNSYFCDKRTPVSFVNTCTPELTFYIAGSSALGSAVQVILNSNNYWRYFDTSQVPVIRVVDNGSANGVGKSNRTNTPHGFPANAVSAWYGMSQPHLTGGISKPVLIVYNSYLGSVPGVSQVLAASTKTFSTIPEADVVTVGPTSKRGKILYPNNCIAYDQSAIPITYFYSGVINGANPTLLTPFSNTVLTASDKVACSTHAPTPVDLAISDVDVKELVALYPEAAKAKLSAFTRTPLAMQGFAVAVNNNFYNALQAYQISNNTLPYSCTVGTYTEECQPNLSRAKYTSLVSLGGRTKSAADFIPGDVTPLTLVLRNQLSGVQAASNIFFLANPCNKLDTKSKINSHGGALIPLSAANNVFAPGLVVKENAQNREVDRDLIDMNGYSIGVIPLNRANVGNYNYKLVKLDGASPNFAKGGTWPLYGGSLRMNMIDGTWPFQMTSYAVAHKDATTYSNVMSPKAAFIRQMIADLSDSSLHDLSAIAYFNGDVHKKTLVRRDDGNNCSPLN